MKIGIDCRELKGQKGGFRSYLVGILAGLCEIDEENTYVLYCFDKKNLDGLRLPKNHKIRTIPFGRFKCDFFGLAKIIDTDKCDLVHFPANSGVFGLKTPYIITLHDSIMFNRNYKQASKKAELFVKYSRFMIKNTINRAARIITVSEYSKNNILATIKIKPEIHPIKNGITTKDCGIYKSDKPYFMTLASVDARKNTTIILKAFALSQIKDRKLVVVASHSSAYEMVKNQAIELGVVDMVEIKRDVDDTLLMQLYKGAECFIFPSLDEGFGLPPLEAMSLGTCVISSNVTSMPEVLGDAAIYFNPHSAQELAEKMIEITKDTTKTQALALHGIEHAKTYTWANNARKLLCVYQDAYKNQ